VFEGVNRTLKKHFCERVLKNSHTFVVQINGLWQRI
jgi:hypothetical protein